MSQKLNIDLSGTGGLMAKFFGDNYRTQSQPNLRIKGKPTQMAEGVYNPYKRYGFASPATDAYSALTYSGGTADALIGCSIYDDINDQFYMGERGLQLWKGSSGGLDATQLTRARNVTGATFTDLEIYQVNGVRKLFYAYQKSGGGNIGMVDLPDTTWNDTWLSGTVSGAFNTGATNNVLLRVADNGFMYVLDGASLHKIDGTTNGGTNGTATANVLLFPAYFQLTDAIDYRGTLMIAILQSARNIQTTESLINYSSLCGVYVWDRLSSQTNMRDYIPLKGVKEIRKMYISPKGTARLICIASNRTTQIREFDGSTFRVIRQMGPGACPRFPDGVEVSELSTFWLADDGHLYAHGIVAPEDSAAFPGLASDEGLFQIGVTTAYSSGDPSATQQAGMILYGGENTFSGTAGFRQDYEAFYLAFKASSTNFVKKFFLNGFGSINSTSQIPHAGNVYSPVTSLNTLGKVNYIRIFCAPGTTTGTTTQATISIYFNRSATAWGTATVNRNDIAQGFKFIPVGKVGVHSVQIKIVYDVNSQLGDYDFAPSLAEVDYDPITKLK